MIWRPAVPGEASPAYEQQPEEAMVLQWSQPSTAVSQPMMGPSTCYPLFLLRRVSQACHSAGAALCKHPAGPACPDTSWGRARQTSGQSSRLQRNSPDLRLHGISAALRVSEQADSIGSRAAWTCYVYGLACARGAAPSCGQIWDIMHQAAPASKCLHTICRA